MKRRETLLILSTGAVAIASDATAFIQSAQAGLKYPGRLKIGTITEMDSKKILHFNFPTEESPAVVFRLPNGQLAAFSTICTHMGCPVQYEASDQLFKCPCHQSHFSATMSGAVVAGPAPRPLPKISVDVDHDGNIYATSISEPPFGTKMSIHEVEEIYGEKKL
ncbi:Rieske 2Fe-2S domain-containing protein [Acidiphilium sp.]|uniref:Rieske 2Fe-2S domain-containing protein n=1 Tax=Acidiphilium sp. TaxID=527 RepID=UPI003D0382B7